MKSSVHFPRTCLILTITTSGNAMLLKIMTLFIAFFLEVTGAQAATVGQVCSEAEIEAVGKHFQIDDFSYQGKAEGQSGVIIDAACRLLPDKSGRRIAAFAYYSAAGSVSGKQMLLVLLDHHKPVSSFASALGEDGLTHIEEGSLQFAEQRYRLAPGVWAYALDVHSVYASSHCLDGGQGALRSLYVIDAAAIRPVLEDFVTSTWNYINPDSDCNRAGAVKASENFYYRLTTGKPRNRGYSNLLITATSTQGLTGTPGVRTRKAFQYVLRYDGKRYPMHSFNGGGDELKRWQN